MGCNGAGETVAVYHITSSLCMLTECYGKAHACVATSTVLEGVVWWELCLDVCWVHNLFSHRCRNCEPVSSKYQR